jgi:hypothetical protein
MHVWSSIQLQFFGLFTPILGQQHEMYHCHMLPNPFLLNDYYNRIFLRLCNIPCENCDINSLLLIPKRKTPQ